MWLLAQVRCWQQLHMTWARALTSVAILHVLMLQRSLCGCAIDSSGHHSIVQQVLLKRNMRTAGHHERALQAASLMGRCHSFPLKCRGQMLQAKNVGSRAEIAEQFLGRLLDAALELRKRKFSGRLRQSQREQGWTDIVAHEPTTDLFFAKPGL